MKKKLRLIDHTVARTFSGRATTPITARPTAILPGSRATKISSIWIQRFTNYISMVELLFNYKTRNYIFLLLPCSLNLYIDHIFRHVLVHEGRYMHLLKVKSDLKDCN